MPTACPNTPFLFHLRSDELKAWRLALRLDPEFARDCRTRMDFLTVAFPDDSDFVDARYSLGDNWPERVRVLQVQGSPQFFDAELDALDNMVMAESIPSSPATIRTPATTWSIWASVNTGSGSITSRIFRERRIPQNS